MSQYSFQWQESHILEFVDKYKSTKDDITAAYLSRHYIPGESRHILTSQDRRKLMNSMVTRGYARATKGNVNSRNFTIRMNSEDIEELYFNSSIFNNSRLWNLPRVECLDENSTVVERLIWSRHGMRWQEICNLLYRYQNEGKIDIKHLQYKWDRDKKTEILLIAKEQIAIYEALKIYSDIISENDTKNPFLDEALKIYSDIISENDTKNPFLDYDGVFLTHLEYQSQWMFNLALSAQPKTNGENQIKFSNLYNLKSQVNGYQTIGQDKNGNYTQENALKAAQQLCNIASSNGVHPYLSVIGSGALLFNLLKQSNNEKVQQAVNKWFQAWRVTALLSPAPVKR